MTRRELTIFEEDKEGQAKSLCSIARREQEKIIRALFKKLRKDKTTWQNVTDKSRNDGQYRTNFGPFVLTIKYASECDPRADEGTERYSLSIDSSDGLILRFKEMIFMYNNSEVRGPLAKYADSLIYSKKQKKSKKDKKKLGEEYLKQLTRLIRD